jgi:Putative polyhydroxyalkanoic acid system protein (PHA_gran_rgn)
MPQINKKYPGKSAGEIYEKVDQAMERLTTKMGLKYDKNPAQKTGKVSKMGISGTYVAVEGEVTIDLHFPMLIPGAMKKQVQEDIERRLDGLFA